MALCRRSVVEVRRRMRVAAFLASLLSSMIARQAVAAGPTDEARAAYQEGVARFLAADYEGALEQFRRAYAIDSNPVLLYNVAQVERKLARWADAAASYRRYLGDDASLSAERRARVEGFLRECEERAASAAVHEGAAPASATRPEAAGPKASEAKPLAPPPIARPVVPAIVAPAPAVRSRIDEPRVDASRPKPSLLRRPWFWGTVVGGVVVAGVTAGLAIGLLPENAPIPDTAGGDVHVMFH